MVNRRIHIENIIGGKVSEIELTNQTRQLPICQILTKHEWKLFILSTIKYCNLSEIFTILLFVKLKLRLKSRDN